MGENFGVKARGERVKTVTVWAERQLEPYLGKIGFWGAFF